MTLEKCILPLTTTHLECVAQWLGVLQFGAGCCSVLQCGAVRCSVLLYDAV